MNLSPTRPRLLPALTAAALFVGANAVYADDWAGWRGPQGNGVTREKVVNLDWSASGPPKLWTANVGKSYAAVAVKGRRVFAMGSQGGKETITCFDAETGDIKWKRAYAHPKRPTSADPNPTATGATPVADGDRVYTLDREGVALCLNAANGEIVWKQDLRAKTGATALQFGFTGAPLIEKDLAIYNVGNGGTALNKVTGALAWKSGGDAGYSTPVSYMEGGKRAVALSTGSGVCAVDPANGKKLWQHTWKTRFDVNAIDPVVSGGQVFITAYDRAQMLRVEGGKVRVAFEPRNMKNTYITPVLIGDHLYGNDNGFLRCVEWKTGKTLWGERGLGSGALIAAGSDLVVLTENGELIVAEANPAKYVEKAKAKVMEGKCWTQPVLANGRLYCRNNDGALVCLDLRAAR